MGEQGRDPGAEREYLARCEEIGAPLHLISYALDLAFYRLRRDWNVPADTRDPYEMAWRHVHHEIERYYLPRQRGAAAPPAGQGTTVQVGEQQLVLTGLDTIVVGSGTTKRDLLEYYARAAPSLLRHLHDRPVTVARRSPGTVGAQLVDDVVAGPAPDWLRVATLPGGRGRRTGPRTPYPLIDDLAGLTWLVNDGAISLRVPPWRVAAGDPDRIRPPDQLVLALVPRPPATVGECCQAAVLLRERLAEDGITDPVVTTDATGGLQLRAAIRTTRRAAPAAYAHRVAADLARQVPDLITTPTGSDQYQGRVVLDPGPTDPAHRSIAPYSVFGRPSVATPLSWDEISTRRAPEDLVFAMDDVLDRIARLGDLAAPLSRPGPALPR